jgi:serine/threonine protein kinase
MTPPPHAGERDAPTPVNAATGDIVPGTMIGGTYRAISELGRGAMGIVWLALDERLERRVAVKVIRRDVVDPGFYARFVQEARAMAQVNHPNVVCIYSFGEHEGTPYFVTELVEGVTLETWLESGRGPPDLAIGLRILDDVCSAVEAIHAAGTVHRDLKPSNILVDSTLRSRVADFGVSIRAVGNALIVGARVGTPAYMAPEVSLAEGHAAPPSVLADVYSLGCIAFEVLTGRRPFRAHGEFAWMMQHLTQPVPLPSSVRVDLPHSFDRVLLGALAKDPAARTQSVAALRQALVAARARALEPERILVAEDDDDFRTLLELGLRGAFPDADVECVANGGMALEALEQRPASIALIDLSMPVLDGVALTSALRSRRTSARMPIIVFTGHGGAREWQALSSIGADRFLVKPVILEDLVALIRRSLAEATQLRPIENL